MLSDAIHRALAIHRGSSSAARTIDITTIGAKTGKLRRIEIWLHRVDGGRWYLSSLPASPGWYANLRANPNFTVHLKNGVRADLAATAHAVSDPAERLRIFQYIVDDLNQPANPGMVVQPQRVADWMAGSPLMEVRFDEL